MNSGIYNEALRKEKDIKSFSKYKGLGGYGLGGLGGYGLGGFGGLNPFLGAGHAHTSSKNKKERFCSEWSKYIDAFDLIPARKGSLPYSMNKSTGSNNKSSVTLSSGQVIFVPVLSNTLKTLWNNPKTAEALNFLTKRFYKLKKEHMSKKKFRNRNPSMINGREMKKGEMILKQVVDKIKKLAKGTGRQSDNTLKSCFSIYQKRAHERLKAQNVEQKNLEKTILSLYEEVKVCTNPKVKTGNRLVLKSVEEIIEHVEKKRKVNQK